MGGFFNARTGETTRRTAQEGGFVDEKDIQPEEDEQTQETQEALEQQDAQPAPEPKPEIDWKAEARKWEARAKRGNAEELAAANERAEKAEAELAAANAQIAREQAARRVSEATGVPVGVLRGDTEDEMAAHAQAVAEYARALKPTYPADKGGAQSAPAVTAASIEAIEDPIERIKKRAENAHLYR